MEILLKNSWEKQLKDVFMKLIVGLGNPGEKYARTRHNVGFMVVDELARKFTIYNVKFTIDKKANAEILKTKYKDEDLILVKPLTMMNASGMAVSKLLRYYDIKKLDDLWVIHDDLDLPLGKVKIVKGHGSAGHHGIESIIKELKTEDFVRFRIGIGFSGKIDERQNRRRIENFVLEELKGKEAVEADKVVKKTTEIFEYSLQTSLEKGMNRYNAK